jgi:ABC-2 type transport system permease protein
MLTDLLIEIRKLKGSLVLALCVVAPTLVALLLAVVCIRQPRMAWHNAMMGTTGLWAYFIMPMTVTALSVLVAQIEHARGAWDHLLALPVRRWRIFAAKGLLIMLLTTLISLILALEIRVVAAIITAVLPQKAPLGEYPWALCFKLLAMMWGASLCMVMLQLWVALAFRSFVAPLTTGLAGTFFAVAAFGARETVFIPWVMPVSVIARNGDTATLALQLGVGGGLAVFLLMTLHLSRKEA